MSTNNQSGVDTLAIFFTSPAAIHHFLDVGQLASLSFHIARNFLDRSLTPQWILQNHSNQPENFVLGQGSDIQEVSGKGSVKAFSTVIQPCGSDNRCG
jgi:hypothetical protein